MPQIKTLGILSDIHYASAGEQARGDDYEFRGLANPLLKLILRAHRRFIWLHQPLHQNHLVDAFIERSGAFDFVIANGDYSCDSAFLGVSDDAACDSARQCLGKLRRVFGTNFKAAFGDHELGKMGFFGGVGGMRLSSWHRSRRELDLEPLWQMEIGNYLLLGVTSSLIALPVFESDILPEERQEWELLRTEHLSSIRKVFAELRPRQKVVLFCHDPSALPFLFREDTVRAKLDQVEQTIIGHLHSNLIFWQSKLLAGMPRITFLGYTAKRITSALHEAKCWRPFKVRLCPSLAGIELLKDGGYLTAKFDPAGAVPVQFTTHRLPRARPP